MRSLASPILILSLAATGNGPDAEDNPAERLRAMRAMVDGVTVEQIAGSGRARLERWAEPVYRFDDAARHTTDGTVWIWGRLGRPSAVMTLTKHRPPTGNNHWLTELASLAPSPIVTIKGFGTWQPRGAGVVLQKFPKAPRPAEDATKRLRQMKELVRQIKAHENSRPQGKASVKRYELRVLPQPVHRYADAKSGLIDGGLFILAYGLNPELVLLVEARREGSSEPAWHCGFARVSLMALHVDFENKEIWSSSDPDDTYRLFTRPIVGE